MLIIETIAPTSNEETILRIAKQTDAKDYWVSSRNENQIAVKVLVEKANSQKVLDQLQDLIAGKTNCRVIAYPLEVALPYEKTQQGVSREALLNQLAIHGPLDMHYMLLVFLSTIVAAIGLISNNVAVIIGAMVIAPLLGPNLSLSLAITLGKTKAIFNSVKALFAGIGFALLLSYGLGVFYPTLYPELELTSELLSRTQIGLDSLALALASGAAAALSITTGVSSVLVGVMVAVALLPPAVTLGICLGLQAFPEAMGAGLLLLANVASVNLTAQITMRAKGIKPRDPEQQRTALIVFVVGLLFWVGIIGYLISHI